MQTLTDKDTMIQQVHQLCLQNHLTFVSYRYPRKTEIHTMIQYSGDPVELNSLTDITGQQGFVVAPFSPSPNTPVYLVRPDYYFTDSEIDESLLNELSEQSNSAAKMALNGFHQEVSKEKYMREINEIIAEIRKGEFEKAVLSRIHPVEGDYEQKISRIFSLVCETYQNAFVYLFRIGHHFWLGATPEPLIYSDQENYRTVSLAATRMYSQTNTEISNWNKKERQEQQYVTHYIEDVLDRLGIRQFRKSGPSIRKAGHLLHLCTEFEIPVQEVNDQLGALISNLHPTSSVCGLPKEKALGAISRLEAHHREYYAGFLGTINMEEKIKLFVNLRCMKIYPHHLALFVGGGITADSYPEDEWEETKMKVDTLKSIISKIDQE